MRIGLIVYGLDRPLTGIGRYTLELVRGLAQFTPKPDVTLLCAGDVGGHEGVNSFPRVSLFGSRLLPGLMTIGQLVINRIAVRLQLDLIHDPTGVTPLVFARRQVGTVATVHDVFAWSIPGYSSLLDTLIYKQWLPYMLPKTDAVITVSKRSRQDILHYLAPANERVEVVPYGVTDRFRPRDEGSIAAIVQKKLGIRRPYILYVGALTQRKNTGRLIEAYARLRGRVPELMLVLAGPGSWRQTPIETTIQSLGLEGDVHLTGPLTDEELPALYNGARLFAFPSLYEGFGLPALEAMACGTPVVTSNVSSLPEVVGDAALTVDPYDVDALANAMLEVLENPVLAEGLSQKGLKRASQFTWERTARETLALYQQVYQRSQE